MLYFRFVWNGDKLVSIDGVKGNWKIVVNGFIVPINDCSNYIPPNGTTVLFERINLPESVDADDSRLLKYGMNQNS